MLDLATQVVQLRAAVRADVAAEDDGAAEHHPDVVDGDRQVRRVAVPHGRQHRIAGGQPGEEVLDRAVGVRGQHGRVAVRVEAAVPAAVAAQPVVVDPHVADLAGQFAVAAVHRVLDQHRATDAVRQADVEGVVDRRLVPELREPGGLRVVDQPRLVRDVGGEVSGAEPLVVDHPAVRHPTGGPADQAGHRDPDPEDEVTVDTGLRDRRRHLAPDEGEVVLGALEHAARTPRAEHPSLEIHHQAADPVAGHVHPDREAAVRHAGVGDRAAPAVVARRQLRALLEEPGLEKVAEVLRDGRQADPQTVGDVLLRRQPALADELVDRLPGPPPGAVGRTSHRLVSAPSSVDLPRAQR
ncbi:hypothetical protein SDC9_83218 [bioreactor metagenome]|uniref:Uncharacterized protein n=1 Tax=bioreactor metagenome TaxID=1076179 RepID=A0A644Z7K6_9ZZZZ